MTERIRTVITTDGEVDDMNSFIRALYYSNDMDICGIVLTASMYHYAGNAEKGIAPYRWTGIEWVNYGSIIDTYSCDEEICTYHHYGQDAVTLRLFSYRKTGHA